MNASQFHFHLYYDTLSAGNKGHLVYVFMIDVDRPNVKHGICFFQQCFSGECPDSPNDLTFLFFPLYKNSYTEEEHSRIIFDHDHFKEGVSVVAIQGVGDLNNIVNLNHGVHMTIRKLVLSIPSQGTTSGKLFIQIKWQANSAWLLCCFHSSDAAKVTLHLGQLESLLFKYINPIDHKNLFDEYGTMKYCGYVAPITKSKPKLPRYEVPEHTQTYAAQ